MPEKPSYEELERALKESETSRRQIRDAFDAYRQKVSLLVKQTLLGVIEWGPDFKVVQWNPAAEKIFGYSRDEALGRDGNFILPKSEMPRGQAVWDAVTTHGQGLCSTNENVTKQGTLILCDWYNTPLVDENRRIVGVASLVVDVSGRSEMENNLRESEERFSLFMDHLPAVAFIKDEKSRMLYVNSQMTQVFGQKNWIGKTPLELFPEDVAANMVENDQKALKQGSIEVRQTVPDSEGNPRIYQTHKFRIDRLGKPPLLGGFYMDITRRRQADEMLKASEKRFREIIEDVSGICIQGYNLDREVTFWNQASEELYGYRKDEALGVKIEDLIIPDLFKERAKRLHREWLDSGKKIPAEEMTLVDKAGNTVSVYSSHIMHETAHGREMFCFDVNMGPVKQAQDALKKSQRLFRLITENTSALVSIVDADGNYMFASSSHERLGFTGEELAGMSGLTMIKDEDVDTVVRHFENATSGKVSKTYLNYRLRDKKGGTHYYRGSFDAVFKEDGELESIICVSEDITEIRLAQAEKVEALALAAETKKQALVGQVAGKMAHDFNNILSIIMGTAEMSMIDCRDKEILKALELIFEQTARGRNLTKNLVVFAKDQEPKQEYFRINKKIGLVLNLLKKDLEGIRVRREYDQNGPELLADPGMIEHALVNLLQNSIHATSLVQNPEIIIRTFDLDDKISIEVKDNGCGIPEAFLGQIFEPSFTLKGSRDRSDSYKPDIKGTGYGMANVKKYIDQHKGDITIRSKVNRGTTVHIVLPAIKKALKAEEIIKVRQENLYREKYVLLVEDEQAIADIQYRILTQPPCNHRVDIAANGQMAMDLLSRNTYDMVSLDYMLPGQINGMDIYRHVRAFDTAIPILFISGNLEFIASIKELKQQDRNIDHLSKPCMNIDYVRGMNRLFHDVLSV
ncbi:MAG: PAS domain S-box protein [Desulfobacter sp.]